MAYKARLLVMYQILISALRETLFMVGTASLITVCIGIPLGVFIASIESSPFKLIKGLYYLFYSLIQFVKFTPYLLIMLLCIPLSNILINHNISYIASTVIPLSIVGSLLLAQKVHEIMSGLSEQWSSTSKAMGASATQTLRLILLPEGLQKIFGSCFHVCSLIVGFTAVAGALGAGGLGQLAIEKSITEPEPLYVIACILMLVALQQLIQYTGTLVVQQKQPR